MIAIIIILKCLLVILLTLLLLLCLLLFIPFTYIFSGYVSDDILLNGYVKWLFGLIKISAQFENNNLKFILSICKINFNISRLISKRKSSTKHKTSNKHKKSIKKKKHFSINSIPSTYKKFKDILTIIKPNYFNISGYFGFTDPYATGQVTAFLATFIHSEKINLIPVFDKEIIDIKAELKGRIRGYLLCYVFLRNFFKDKFTFLLRKVKLFNNKKCIN